MKNMKRRIAAALTACIGLAVIPFAVAAQDGKANSQKLDDEYVNLGKVNEFTVAADEKLPEATVKKILIQKGTETVEGTTLRVPGDYDVKLYCDEATYQYQIICYKRGDANIDGSCDVRDLVAAMRGDVHTEISARYGADMDGSTIVDATDCMLLRKLLVGRGLVLPEPGDRVDAHMMIDTVSLSGSRLSLTFENTSKVWEAGEDSYVEFTYYGEGDVVLSTERAELGIVEPGKTTAYVLTLPAETRNVKVTGYDFDYWSIVVK